MLSCISQLPNVNHSYLWKTARELCRSIRLSCSFSSALLWPSCSWRESTGGHVGCRPSPVSRSSRSCQHSFPPRLSHWTVWSPVWQRRRELQAEGKRAAGIPPSHCQVSPLPFWGWEGSCGSTRGAPGRREGSKDAAAGSGLWAGAVQPGTNSDNVHTQINTQHRIWHSTVLPELVTAF